MLTGLIERQKDRFVFACANVFKIEVGNVIYICVNYCAKTMTDRVIGMYMFLSVQYIIQTG